MEKADRKLTNIVVPECQGGLPSPWWTMKDDQCLTYGTWKHGYARYDEMNQDQDIPFTCKSYKTKNLPLAMVLTSRIKKLANGIMKNNSSERDQNFDNIKSMISN